tara:strand:+ start:888 stop:1817 length:930 start_codon:yes stop_codon:yes gene_type:complete
MKFKKPKFWDYKNPNLLAYILLPFTLPIYIKNIFSTKTLIQKENLKKICVGNIYLGGTGKTPLAIKISDMFKNKKSSVIKKFYKDQIDEQKLIKKYSNIICKTSRVEALKIARKKKLDYVIFDDGLQDKSINYDLKIVCFNNVQWIGNGFLIPAGPLREGIKSLKKYDAVILNGDSSKNKFIKKTIKKISNKLKIFESYYKPVNLNKFNIKKNYVVFSGIGNNNNFTTLLKNNSFNIFKNFNFPDHYSFKSSEINNIIKYAKNNNCKIITTEKDFLRLDDKFKNKMEYLKIEIKIKKYDTFYKYIKKKL